MALAMLPDSFNVSFFDEDLARKNFDHSADYVVGYGRLSFDEDGEGYCSIINQRDILAEFYEKKFKNAASSYDFVADDNVSGYKFDRQGLFDVLQRIENGRCNILLAKDLSRIGRHGALTQLFIEQCERVGVRIVAMDDYDSHKESDELILGIRAWSNERVVKDTSAKILKIIKHKQKAGTWFCAAPFGYKVLDYAAGTVEIEEGPSEIVRRIAELFLAGNGVNKIARILSAEGVATPSMHYRDQAIAEGKEYRKKVSTAWTGAQISKMLDDEFYVGTLVTGRYKRQGINGKDVRTKREDQNRFEDHHAAIWSKEMFEKIQERRQGRREENYRGVKKNESLFHGILQCGECGQKLYAYSRPDLDKQYICSNHFKYGKSACSRHMIKEKTLVRIAIEYLTRIRSMSEEIIATLDEDVRNAKKAAQKRRITVEQMQKELAGLEEELHAIESQRVKQILRQPEKEDLLNQIYDDMHLKTQTSIERLRKEIGSMSDESIGMEESLRQTKTALAVIDSVLESGELQRRDIEELFKKIIVYEDGRVVIRLKPEFGALETEDMTIVERSAKQPERVYAVKTENVGCEGDPLEIFTDHDGEVVLKKYSPIGEIATIAKDYTDSLYRTLGHIALISDRDAVVSASGANKREYIEKALSPEVDQILQARQLQMLNLASGARMIPVTNDDHADAYSAQIVAPILTDGEIIGSLILLSRESGTQMSEVDQKVAETTASIVGRQMEQ